MQWNDSNFLLRAFYSTDIACKVVGSCDPKHLLTGGSKWISFRLYTCINPCRFKLARRRAAWIKKHDSIVMRCSMVDSTVADPVQHVGVAYLKYSLGTDTVLALPLCRWPDVADCRVSDHDHVCMRQRNCAGYLYVSSNYCRAAACTSSTDAIITASETVIDWLSAYGGWLQFRGNAQNRDSIAWHRWKKVRSVCGLVTISLKTPYFGPVFNCQEECVSWALFNGKTATQFLTRFTVNQQFLVFGSVGLPFELHNSTLPKIVATWSQTSHCFSYKI